MNDARVLTTALVAARYFGGNLALGQRYPEQHGGGQTRQNGFCRRLHALADAPLAALFAAFGQVLKQRHTQVRCVIDSFPVAGCHNPRTPRCKLWADTACHGRCASKRGWFYGFQAPLITTTDGIPVACYVHTGAEADHRPPRPGPGPARWQRPGRRRRLHRRRGRRRGRTSHGLPPANGSPKKQPAAPRTARNLSDSALPPVHRNEL